MNYIHLLNRFWHFQAVHQLNAHTSCLYLFLVHTCNRQRWTNPFALADTQICQHLGMARNTMRPARAQLVALGLLAYEPGGNGRGHTAQYALRDSDSHLPPLRAQKGAVNPADAAPLAPVKGATKGVEFAPYSYIEENKTISLNEEVNETTTATREEKKGEVLEKKGRGSQLTNADASASHTGGGADRGPLLRFAASPYGTEAGIREVAESLNLGAAYAPYYLARISAKTAGEPDRYARGWRTYVQHFLTLDARHKQLVTASLTADSPSPVNQRLLIIAQASAQLVR